MNYFKYFFYFFLTVSIIEYAQAQEANNAIHNKAGKLDSLWIESKKTEDALFIFSDSLKQEHSSKGQDFAPILEKRNANLFELNLYAEEEFTTNNLESFTSTEDVKVFINSILIAALPPNYLIPNYISNSKTYLEASNQINIHYPEFSFLKGNVLLEAIMINPVLYKRMMMEYKAARSLFANPN